MTIPGRLLAAPTIACALLGTAAIAATQQELTGVVVAQSSEVFGD